jgi:hypothetical protein
MQVRISPTLTANPILTLEDLGLERSVGLDQASRGLAERSEAQIVRWVHLAQRPWLLERRYDRRKAS